MSDVSVIWMVIRPVLKTSCEFHAFVFEPLVKDEDAESVGSLKKIMQSSKGIYWLNTDA